MHAKNVSFFLIFCIHDISQIRNFIFILKFKTEIIFEIFLREFYILYSTKMLISQLINSELFCRILKLFKEFFISN